MPGKDRERPGVTVDVVVIAQMGGHCTVLLVQRRNPPFAGLWALPGGFVEPHETLEMAARRELREETGLEPARLEQLAAFGDPGRDPRGWIISVAFLTHLDESDLQERDLQAGSDAAEVSWFDVHDLPPMAFDHAEILARARCSPNKMGWRGNQID
jgi:8-oxo-dGTP diphosphatase